MVNIQYYLYVGTQTYLTIKHLHAFLPITNVLRSQNSAEIFSKYVRVFLSTLCVRNPWRNIRIRNNQLNN